MIGINTSRGIAAMQYIEAVRDRTAKEFPCDAMGINNAFAALAPLKLAIAFGLAGSPKPACFRLANVRPEPSRNTAFVVIVAADKSVLHGLAAAALAKLRGIEGKLYNLIVHVATSMWAMPRGVLAPPRCLYA